MRRHKREETKIEERATEVVSSSAQREASSRLMMRLGSGWRAIGGIDDEW